MVLTGGSLWNARQAYNYSPYAPKLAADSGGSDEERIAAGASAASTLYRGMRVQQWGVPSIVYLVALVESCENTLQGSVPFWEGAVRVYKEAACTEAIGYGFVEQMGYN